MTWRSVIHCFYRLYAFLKLALSELIFLYALPNQIVRDPDTKKFLGAFGHLEAHYFQQIFNLTDEDAHPFFSSSE